MYYISKRIEVAFAHQLNLTYESKCQRFHGHNGIVTIYCCIGVDLTRAKDDWFESLPDSTARLHLPAIGLLDSRFIDEARTRTFYEKGSIPPTVLDELYNSASQKMRRRCLTPQNMQRAENNARTQFFRIFQQLGFKRVDIVFEKR